MSYTDSPPRDKGDGNVAVGGTGAGDKEGRGGGSTSFVAVRWLKLESLVAEAKIERLDGVDVDGLLLFDRIGEDLAEFHLRQTQQCPRVNPAPSQARVRVWWR